jgi:hypothetical protein
MAIPLIKHSHISRKNQAPGTAAAHIRYITRQSATVLVYSERMPKQYHAAQRFMDQRENSIRKDGRVCDKFIIAVPREMTVEQAYETVQKFGRRLSQGKTPFFFTLQDWGTPNPHCHFVLVDAHVETGRRVVKTTDLNSSARIKEIWEDTANGELARHGYEERISFADAAEKKRLKSIEEQLDGSRERLEASEPSCPELHLAEDAPALAEEGMADPEQELEDHSLERMSEEERAEFLKGVYIARDLPAPPLPHERVKKALDHDLQRARLSQVRFQLLRLKHEAELHQEAAKALTAHASKLTVESQQASMALDLATERLGGFGRWKGLRIKLGPIDLRSPRRKAYEATVEDVGRKEFVAGLKQSDLRKTRDYAELRAEQAEVFAERQAELETKTYAQLEAEFGKAVTIESAEQILANSADRELIEHEILLAMDDDEQEKLTLPAVTALQVYNDYENGNLTKDEAIRALELMNEPSMIHAVELRHRQELEQEAANDNEIDGGYEM